MNDRYLFKAKRIDNGEWVQGALFDGENHCIIGQEIKFSPYVSNECKIIGYEVDRNTLCQCTGLMDKAGILIWENDIIRCGRPTLVSWNEKFSSWCLTRKGWLYSHFFGESQEPEECVVIGNIFDNPELLEVDR